MDETKRRSQRARRVIKFCKDREKTLRGRKHAENLILAERLKPAREREEHERKAYLISLRQQKQLSPREIAAVREREERDRESFMPNKRPRTRRRVIYPI
jgi:hypothetical protein